MNKILLLFAIVTNFTIHAQTEDCSPKIKYEYDAAGNRIVRQAYPLCRLADDQEETQSYSETSNLSNMNGFQIKLFPNPTNGQMLAETTEGFMELENKAVYIQTMKGELLHKNEITKSSFTLDFTTLAPGYYIVRILANGYSKNWKVQRLQ